MKKMLQNWMMRIGMFLDKLGEDFNMECTEDIYCIGRPEMLNDLVEEYAFA